MSVTEQDRERALGMSMRLFAGGYERDHATEVIAQALAEERDRARAPFLAYADKCAAIGNDSKTGFLKRAVNRSVAQAFHRAAEETDQ